VEPNQPHHHHDSRQVLEGGVEVFWYGGLHTHWHLTYTEAALVKLTDEEYDEDASCMLGMHECMLGDGVS